MNDPNGLIYFGNKYRLYYQAYPFSSTNGVMHWGGYVSDDLITYDDLGVVIAPDCNGEKILYAALRAVRGKERRNLSRHKRKRQGL